MEKISKLFQGSSKGISRKMKGCSSMEFRDNFKAVLRKFPGGFKERVMFQGCFKNVSMKYCFAFILLLHGSHCSYSKEGFFHREAPRIKKLILRRLTRAPIIFGIVPFTDPISHCEVLMEGMIKYKLSWECHTRRYKFS